MREQGWSRSSPPATARAKSVPDAAVTNGVQRGATGTPTVTPQYSPWPVIAAQGSFLLVWRVKDSNLGRHQPTDLQSAAPERRRPCAGSGSGTGAELHEHAPADPSMASLRSQPRALATPASLRDGPTGATLRMQVGLRAIPTTSRRATTPRQGGAYSSTLPILSAAPLDPARSGYAKSTG